MEAYLLEVGGFQPVRKHFLYLLSLSGKVAALSPSCLKIDKLNYVSNRLAESEL